MLRKSSRACLINGKHRYIWGVKPMTTRNRFNELNHAEELARILLEIQPESTFWKG